MALSFKSILRPSESVMTSLATAGIVYGIYQLELPPVTEVHGAMPHNSSVYSSQKKAMWVSAAVVGGAFLVTRDATVFSAGALMFLGLEWSYRHANSVHPGHGKMVPYASSDMMNAEYTDTTVDQNDDMDYGNEGY